MDDLIQLYLVLKQKMSWLTGCKNPLTEAILVAVNPENPIVILDNDPLEDKIIAWCNKLAHEPMANIVAEIERNTEITIHDIIEKIEKMESEEDILHYLVVDVFTYFIIELT